MFVATLEPFAFVEVNKAGTSVLLVEQNARCALDICHEPKDEG
jgi:ABC-type branched-subunit amino acid transport system ATPase component